MSTVSTWTWNWGDGTIDHQGPDANHTYAEPGAYVITVSAQTETGILQRTHQVTVVDTAASADPDTAGLTGPEFAAKAYPAQTVGIVPVLADGQVVDHIDWGDGDYNNDTITTGVRYDHTYVYAGSKTITLAGANDDQGNPTFTITHRVFVGDVVLGAASFTSSVTDQTVYLFNACSGTPTDFLWDLGDGTTSTDTALNHTYAKPGIYTVTLTAYFGNQGSDIATKQVTVNVVPAALTVASVAGSTVTVTASLAGGTGTVHWGDRDANGVALITAASTDPMTHTYASPGTYQIVLTGRDYADADFSISKTVTIAGASGGTTDGGTTGGGTTGGGTGGGTSTPGTPSLDLTATGLTASATAHWAGQQFINTAVYWDLSDPGTLVTDGQTITHNYTTAGTYDVIFRTLDNNAYVQQYHQNVTVAGSAAPSTVGFTAIDARDVNVQLTFTGTGRGTFDWGDGHAYSDWTWTPGNSRQSHNYASYGTYIIRATGVDSQGLPFDVSQTVTIEPQQNPDFTGGQTSTVAIATPNFVSNGSTNVDWGDGVTDTNAYGAPDSPFSHRYGRTGTYAVHMTGRTNGGVAVDVSHPVTYSGVDYTVDADPFGTVTVTITQMPSWAAAARVCWDWDKAANGPTSGSPDAVFDNFNGGTSVSYTYATAGPRTLQILFGLPAYYESFACYETVDVTLASGGGDAT